MSRRLGTRKSWFSSLYSSVSHAQVRQKCVRSVGLFWDLSLVWNLNEWFGLLLVRFVLAPVRWSFILSVTAWFSFWNLCHLWLSQTFLPWVFANMVKRTWHWGWAIVVPGEPFIPKKCALGPPGSYIAWDTATASAKSLLLWARVCPGSVPGTEEKMVC